MATDKDLVRILSDALSPQEISDAQQLPDPDQDPDRGDADADETRRLVEQLLGPKRGDRDLVHRMHPQDEE